MSRRETANMTRGVSEFDPEKYQAEQDFEVLVRADAVRKDPDRLKAAKDLAREKVEKSKPVEQPKEEIDLSEEK